MTAGSVVTLTATVLSGGSVVTPGEVNFCDAAAKLCSDIHLLGTAQLTSNGTAILRFMPGVGTYHYKAVFAGTTQYAASASTVTALTVTGPPKPLVTLAQTGPGSDSLSATVFGNGVAGPSGTISYLDTTNADAVLASVELSSGPPGLNMVLTASPAIGIGASGVAVGDFNGDGILDMVIADAGNAATTLLLGNGDGTFASRVVPLAPLSSESVVVGDFNGDGILDLAFGVGYFDGDLVVLLGNGDGSFKPPIVSNAPLSEPSSMVTGDFNGDGILDLAAANEFNENVTIMLGNGDGSFTSTVNLNTPSEGLTTGVATGDFNGDGIADLAVTTWADTVTIFLGNGDGTFTQSPISPSTGIEPSAIAVADLNGDGKADLAVSNLDTVTVLLGNGDGTFAPVGVAPSTGNEPVSVAVGDFNGDGIPDLATVNYAGSDLTILLGKGDGSFAPAPVSPATGISPTALAVGDWNGDGIWDLAAPNSQNAQNGMITDTVSVFVAENQMATTASTAVSLPAGTGTHSVIASYPGNSAYGPGISKPVSLLAPRGNPQISFECSPSPADYGVPVTFTATVTANGSVPTGWVRFMSGTHAYGMAQLNSSGVATEQYTFLKVNQFSMKAIYAGDGDFNPVTSSAVDLVIQKATQIIDFPSPGTRVYLGSGPIALEATTTSGLPIAYDVTGPASVSGSTLTLLGTGAVGITARQNGDDDYQPAKPVEHTIVVVPALAK